MVETIRAQPLPSGTKAGAVSQALTPGAELRAKVDANLPGGIVRLVSEGRPLDLRVPTPLPVGSDVTISVSGTRQQPVIALTTAGRQGGGQGAQIPQGGGGGNPAAPLSQPVPGGGTLISRPAAGLAQLLQATGPVPNTGSVPAGSSPPSPAQSSALQSGISTSPAAAPQGPVSSGGAGSVLPPAGSGQPASSAASGLPPQTSAAAPPLGPAGNTGSGAVVQAQGSGQAQGQGAPAPASAAPSATNVSGGSGLGQGARQLSPQSTPQSLPQTTAPQVSSQPSSAGTSGAPLPGGTAAPATTGAGGGTMPAAVPAGPQALPGSVLTSGASAAPVSTPSGQTGQGTARAGVTVGTGPAAGIPHGQTNTGPSGPGPLASVGGSGGQPAGESRLAAARTTADAYSNARPGGAAPAPAASAGQSAPATPAQQLAAQLRQPLADQQSSLAGLFAQIGTLAAAQSSGKVSLPDAVQKAMQQIFGLRLNGGGQPVTAKSLQQAVLGSGQFREAQLGAPGGRAQGGTTDLKSALLSFRSLLQQLGAEPAIKFPTRQPPHPSRQSGPQGQAPQTSSGFWAGGAAQNLQSLLQETDAALARLRLTQLSNAGLTREEGARTAATRPMDVVVELPLALGQETAVMQLQIGRDGGHQSDLEANEPAWRLRFALDLTATGPLEAAVSLRGGGTYISLWVDRKETLDVLAGVRETMEAAFADAGLDLQELRFIRGLPPKTAAAYGAMINRQS